MEIKKINTKIEGKKGWIRIVEAFAAILLILTVVLLILSRQRSDNLRADEITKLERYVLDYVSEDDTLRAYALSGNALGIENGVKELIPTWLNYQIRTCYVNKTYEDICAFDGIRPSEQVYANEVLIVANLTHYQNATKVKLFLWEK